MTTKKRSRQLSFWVLVDVDGFPWETKRTMAPLVIEKYDYEQRLSCHGPYRIIKVSEVVREVKRK